MNEGDSHYWGIWWGNEPFEEQKEGLVVFVVSDSLVEIDAHLELKMIDFYGDISYVKILDMQIPANCSDKVFTIPSAQMNEFFDSRKMVLSARLYHNSNLLAENNFYLSKPKDLTLPLNVSLDYRLEGKRLSVWSKTGRLMKNVYLQAHSDIHFSRNYFDLLPDDTLSFTVESKTDLLPNLKYTCLNNIR